MEDSRKKLGGLIYKWRRYLTFKPLDKRKKKDKQVLNFELQKDKMTGRAGSLYSGALLRKLEKR